MFINLIIIKEYLFKILNKALLNNPTFICFAFIFRLIIKEIELNRILSQNNFRVFNYLLSSSLLEILRFFKHFIRKYLLKSLV